MTDNSQEEQQILTRDWLAEKLENDRMAEEAAGEERREERDRENIRVAWKQQTGVEPTKAELEKALVEKRHQDVAHAARVNEAEATRQFVQKF
jgi:uncharacterized protein (DUF305 family)